MGCQEIDSFYLGRERLEMSHSLLTFFKKMGSNHSGMSQFFQDFIGDKKMPHAGPKFYHWFVAAVEIGTAG